MPRTIEQILEEINYYECLRSKALMEARACEDKIYALERELVSVTEGGRDD